MRRTRNHPSSVNSAQHQSRLVNDIIRILETKPRKDSTSLRQEQKNMIRKRLMNIQQNNNKPKQSQIPVKKLQLNQLDTERYMQCIYYLTKFGSNEDIINFWMRHNCYEDVLRLILQKSLNSKIFIEVGLRVIHTSGNEAFQSILAKIGLFFFVLFVLLLCLCCFLFFLDPDLVLSKDYLLRFCAMLSSVQAEEILLDTQIFMGDNTRAGLTCVSKAKRAGDNISLQMKYLQTAIVSIQFVCFFYM